MSRLGFVRWSVATLATACLFNATPTWAKTEVAELLPLDGGEKDSFGEDVDICGGVAVIGAREWDATINDNENPDENSGAAYIFRQNGTTWGQEAKLTADDGASGDWFGTSVAICGDTAVIGAPFDDDNGSSSGSAYVFEYDGAVWQPVEPKLTASDAAAGDKFGFSVAIDGDVIVVGALDGDIPDPDDPDDPQATIDNVGTVYVYRRNGAGDWIEEPELFASDAAAFDEFGTSVSVDGNTIVVGARGDDVESGAAYVFEYDGVWSQTAKLTASDGASGDQFGFSVSVSGDSVAVGSYLDDSGSGAAYVYRFNGASWSEEKVTADDAQLGDNFGRSVAIADDTLVVGAFLDAGQTGSMYVFERTGTIWSEIFKTIASDTDVLDQFGVFVSIDGDYAIVGAAGNDDNGSASGSAYVFNVSDNTPPTLIPGTIDANYCSVAAGEEAAIAATTVNDDVSAPEDIVVTATTQGSSFVWITATDEAGNSIGPFPYSTTIDVEAPVVSAPLDAIETTATDPYAPLHPADVGDGTSATATDNCDPEPVITYEDLVVLATATEPTQVIRTWTATDARGNAASEDQTIIVELADTDGDGLTNFDELTIHNTEPALADTDADGLDDGEEVEIAASNDGCPDPNLADADMDTLLDSEEVTLGTSPCNADTDGDGLTDDVDPSPAGPPVSTDVIADGIANLCAYIAATDLDAFRGHRWMHRRVRQAILCWTLRKAEHALECGEPVLARRLLRIVLWRADGEARPLRDWVIDPTAAAAIEADAELLIFLLDVEIGQ